MSDGDFFVPGSEVAGMALDALEDLKQQLGQPDAEERFEPDASVGRLLGMRFAWKCGSWAESSSGYLPGQKGRQIVRMIWSIRGGPVQGDAYERSPWFRPADVEPFRGEGDLALKALGPAPWDVLPDAAAALRELDPVVFAEPKDPARFADVVGDLDGARKRAKKAQGYSPCVDCGAPVLEGQLYEHQAGKTSPRRRIHVACLKARGLG